tara:strand:+ start:57 stop:335 length:279 start_codon:yes stop_codon:yes gene_type:complete
MNLYKKLLEKERLEKNKRSLEYYYNNKDYVLKRQAAKKLYNKEYYKQWYNKNKDIVNSKRRNISGSEKKVNKKYKKKTYDNKDIPKSFTIHF